MTASLLPCDGPPSCPHRARGAPLSGQFGQFLSTRHGTGPSPLSGTGLHLFPWGLSQRYGPEGCLLGALASGCVLAPLPRVPRLRVGGCLRGTKPPPKPLQAVLGRCADAPRATPTWLLPRGRGPHRLGCPSKGREGTQEPRTGRGWYGHRGRGERAGEGGCRARKGVGGIRYAQVTHGGGGS